MNAPGPVRADGLQVVTPPALPLDRLVLGKPVEDVLDLLPRLFNLCKSAQVLALRMACGLPRRADDLAALREEIRRDHLLRVSVIWPARLNIPGGQAGVMPRMSLNGALAASPLMAAIAARFGPGQAVVAPEQEKSVAGRQAHQPLMQQIAQTHGRGPLWRVAARFMELADPALPDPVMKNGWAHVPAARGEYRVRAVVRDGLVTEFARQTPTDDMLRPGGVIDQSLASLPRADDAALLLDILDPCVPLTLKEAHHA